MRSSGEGIGSGTGVCVHVSREMLEVDGGKFGRSDDRSTALTSTKDTLLASGRVRKDCARSTRKSDRGKRDSPRRHEIEPNQVGESGHVHA